ncbi:glutamate racemase [Desulfobulbus propionicus DSM 2032]|jgi:glutamate racemase|uniref:Glutamate racemase n=1 Tax=Desulfobulbus propionicus (strain ATCC 33891 / DSM 2032 / VKM B-1956 / 1pr3) TaxID=577650 RepID=A0A7U3YP16_DESPD|nr:glutamate racemase [Desulfobulbus propionicus]ADW18918.1 glutamate racemase [Desulfobulbus propionicus DSM 2032]
MIGIFDSGVGGMTVARAIEQFCPGFPLVYLGDLARTPYGSKSPAMITEYSHRNTDFLLRQGAKLIVIACNSAASTASSFLRSHYHQLIIDVIFPAVDRAAGESVNGRIGVIGTRATINSGLYEQRLQAARPDCKVYSQACPLLVPLVEEGWLERRETKMIVKKYLHPLRDKQIDTLILGCTHYPLLKKTIAPRIGRRVHIIDSSVEVALHLKTLLDSDHDLRQSLYAPDTPSRFFVSDIPSPVHALASKIFGRTVRLEKTDV